MKKECIHCGKIIDYEKPQQFGAHITNCEKNPNLQKIREKASLNRKIDRLEYSFVCLKCGEKYQIILKKTDFEKGKYSKYCSRKCSNKKNHSDETKKKISNSIKEHIKKNGKFGILLKNKKRNKPTCKICGKEVNKHENIYCSRKCMHKSNDVGKKISQSMKGKNVGEKNGMFGIPPSHKKYYGGIFYSNKNKKDIKYRSSYELKALEILEKDDDVVYYYYEPYSIKYRNGKRSTIIDFEIFYKENKKIVEVKPKSLLNRWNNEEKIKAIKKHCQNNNILFEVWTETELGINKNKMQQ